MTNLELYGTYDVPLIPREVSESRILLLKKHLDKIMEDSFMDRDSYKVSKILQAIEFWRKMSEGEESHG